MENFWNIYETMNEIVYVTDIDTDEIIYINRYGREQLKLGSLEEVKGQPCYRVLQNCSSRCSICTNSRLKVGEFYEWKYYNGMLGRTFLLKDTLVEKGGRRYRIEVSIDVSEMDKHKQTIKEFSSNEAMVNEALRRAFAETSPDNSIKALLKYLGQSLRSDRVYIFEGKRGEPSNNTYEWCNEGVEPQIDILQNVPFEACELWFETFERGENIVIRNLEDIRESNPVTYETLKPQQITSLVTSPIVLDDEVIGYYGVDNPPKEFLNHISVMFLVLGYFMASLIRTKNMMQKLEQISYYDQLTGALNRHGMNEFVANVDHDSSIGVVYCDVMGLKRVNDTEGHLAGDALLKRAYDCMCHVFPKESVFRVGGDEFLAMKSGIPDYEMYERVTKLKATMKDYNVNFAIGAVWLAKCNGRIEALLKEADDLMYQDKEEFYSKNPNDRRAK